MRDRSSIVVIAALAAAGCARVSLPYPIASVRIRPTPVHELSIAVLPFSDARERVDGSDDAESFEYRGVEMTHTDLTDVRGSPEDAITELVARHLAASRIFAQVILVDRIEDAAEADLVLSARIRRARGYVEANERKKESRQPLDERTVLAEVLISDLEVRENRAGRRLLLRSDFGWSIFEERKALPDPPSPWTILAEALFVAGDQVVEALASADLTGSYVVTDSVQLLAVTTTAIGPPQLFGELAKGAPAGWVFEQVESEGLPHGWKGRGRCAEAQLTDRQTHLFHRALGPYKPRVRLWACTGTLALAYDALVEFPARYLGQRADGAHYFSLALGRTNWSRAEAQIGKHLGVTPPARRHVFEISAP